MCFGWLQYVALLIFLMFFVRYLTFDPNLLKLCMAVNKGLIKEFNYNNNGIYSNNRLFWPTTTIYNYFYNIWFLIVFVS